MNRPERRRYRRLRLRLPVLLVGGGDTSPPVSPWVTGNVSAGGMYLHVPRERVPDGQTELSFEIQVPAGVGYSASAGKIKGSGKVVRTDPLEGETVGLAVEFTNPLALEF